MLHELTVYCVLQVKLNRGLDFIQLDDLLVDLKLTPDVLEVPVPRYYIEDRAKVCRQTVDSSRQLMYTPAVQSYAQHLVTSGCQPL